MGEKSRTTQLFLLAIAWFVQFAQGQVECFPASGKKMPQPLSYMNAESGYYEEYYAIDGTGSFVIYGGISDQPKLNSAESSSAKTIVVRFNTDTNVRQWTKFLYDEDSRSTNVVGVTIKNTNQDKVAIVTQSIDQTVSFLIILNTSDGSTVNSQSTKIEHSTAAQDYRFQTSSAAMYYSKLGKVIIAWQFNYDGSKWAGQSGTISDGRLRVGMFDETDAASINSYQASDAATQGNFYNEYDGDYLGRSGAIAFVEGADLENSHIYLGGAVEESTEWATSLFHLRTTSQSTAWPAGSHYNSEVLRLPFSGSDYITCADAASCYSQIPMIDHLRWSADEDRLYGTTRSLDSAKPGASIFVFTVHPDNDGTEIASDRKVRSKQLATDASQYGWFVTGIDSEMISNSSFHALIYDSTNKKLYHVLMDAKDLDQLTATLIYDEIDYIRESFFTLGGSLDGSIKQSYSVGYDSSFPYTSPQGVNANKQSPSSGKMGIMVPSFRSQTCHNLVSTPLTVTITFTATELDFDQGNGNIDNKGGLSSLINVSATFTQKSFTLLDIVEGNLDDRSWCSSYTKYQDPYVITNDGLFGVAHVCPLDFSGSNTYPLSITYPLLDSQICTDYASGAAIWTMWLTDLSTVDTGKMTVTTTQVTTISGVDHSDIELTAHFMLPDSQTTTSTFKLSANACDCSTMAIDSVDDSTLVIADYYIGTAATDIVTFDDTTNLVVNLVKSTCDYSYTYSITPDVDVSVVIDTNHVFTFDEALRTFSIASSVTSNPAHGNALSSDGSRSSPVKYDFEVWVTNALDSSTVDNMKLTFSVNIIDCTAITYDLSGVIQDGAYLISASNTQDDKTLVTSGITTDSTCLAGLNYIIVDSSDNAITSPPFTFDSGTLTLTTQTDDVGLANTYNLKLKVDYGGTSVGEFPFIYELTACDVVSLSLASAPLANLEYTLGDTAIEVVVDEFTPQTVCPGQVTTYTSTVAPVSLTIVTFDDQTRTFTIVGDPASDSSLLLQAGEVSTTYTVTITARSGVVTKDEPFELVVKNPCSDPDLNSITVPAGLTDSYNVGEIEKVVALPSDFTSTLTYCGNIAYTVSATPAAAITYDSANLSVKVFSSDTSLDSTTGEVEIKAYLEDYPTIEAATSVFVYIDFVAIPVETVVEYVVPIETPEPEAVEDAPELVPSEGVDPSSVEYSLETGQGAITLGSFASSTSGQEIIALSDLNGDDQIEIVMQEDGTVSINLPSDLAAGDEQTIEYELTYKTSTGEIKKKTFTTQLSVKATDAAVPAFAGFIVAQDENKVFNGGVSREQLTAPDSAPPTMKIKQIQMYGTVTISFSEPFIIPSNATESVNKEVLKLSVLAMNPPTSPMLGFDWELISFDTTQMQLQLTFENPIYVSKDRLGLDRLQIDVLQGLYFTSKASAKHVVEDTILIEDIPQQVAMAEKAVMEQRQAQAESIQGSSSAIVGANLAINIVMSSSLALLWGLVNSLQIIAHFKLLRVVMPTENVKLYYDILYELATFDVIPTDDLAALAQEQLGIQKDETLKEEAINQQTQEGGYESADILENNFNTFMLLVGVIVVLLFVGLLYILFKKFQKVRTLAKSIWRKIFWNTFLRSILETSIEIIIASMIKTKSFSTEDGYQTFSSIYTILTIVLIGILSISIPIFLHKNRKNLRRKWFIAKYGSLILNHRTKKDFSPKLYQFFFLQRRLILGALIVYAGDQIFFQFSVMTFATSIQVIYVGLSMPFELPWLNKLELFNEYIVLTCCTFLFAYSDGLLSLPNPGYPEYDEWISDEETKLQLGWSNVGLLLFFVLVNLMIMVVNQCKALKLKLKRFFNRRKYKKMLKEAEAQKKLQMTLQDLVYDDMDSQAAAASQKDTRVEAVGRINHDVQRKHSPLKKSKLLRSLKSAIAPKSNRMDQLGSIPEEPMGNEGSEFSSVDEQTLKQLPSGSLQQSSSLIQHSQIVIQDNTYLDRTVNRSGPNDSRFESNERLKEAFADDTSVAAPSSRNVAPVMPKQSLFKPNRQIEPKLSLNPKIIDIDNLYSPMEQTPVAAQNQKPISMSPPEIYDGDVKTPSPQLNLEKISNKDAGASVSPMTLTRNSDFMKKVMLPKSFVDMPNPLSALERKQSQSNRDTRNQRLAQNNLFASAPISLNLSGLQPQKNQPASSRIQFFAEPNLPLDQGGTFDNRQSTHAAVVAGPKTGREPDLLEELESMSRQDAISDNPLGRNVQVVSANENRFASTHDSVVVPKAYASFHQQRNHQSRSNKILSERKLGLSLLEDSPKEHNSIKGGAAGISNEMQQELLRLQQEAEMEQMSTFDKRQQ